jgi:hypothetical protein
LSVLAAYGLVRACALAPSACTPCLAIRCETRTRLDHVIDRTADAYVHHHVRVASFDVIALAHCINRPIDCATDWLDRNASYADGVLAAYNTGTIIPRRPVRVMLLL